MYGGARLGAGRKSKAEEARLAERLAPMDDTALALLQKGIKAGDFQYLKLFMEYRFSKPKQDIDVTTAGLVLNGMRQKENAPMALNGQENGHAG